MSPTLPLLLLFLLHLPTFPSQPILTTSTGVEFVRTPSSRFSSLPDFPHPPRYVLVSGLRMSYIDAGYALRGTILLLHGEPDWSFLYHRMIPVFTKAGFRVVAPDFIGFGRSDKPIDRASYTVDNHVDWIKQFVVKIGLENSHIFVQDWGGLIGLTVVAEMPHLFDRLVIANTALPADGEVWENPLFQEFVQFTQNVDPFVASDVLDGVIILRNLTESEKAAYDAPFPSELYQAGVRQFPMIVPRNASSPGAARFRKARNVFKTWNRPVLLQWGLQDIFLDIKFYEGFRTLIPGTKGQPHSQYPEAGHFIQEDVGPNVAVAVVQWLKDTDPSSCDA